MIKISILKVGIFLAANPSPNQLFFHNDSQLYYSLDYIETEFKKKYKYNNTTQTKVNLFSKETIGSEVVNCFNLVFIVQIYHFLPLSIHINVFQNLIPSLAVCTSSQNNLVSVHCSIFHAHGFYFCSIPLLFFFFFKINFSILDFHL